MAEREIAQQQAADRARSDAKAAQLEALILQMQEHSTLKETSLRTEVADAVRTSDTLRQEVFSEQSSRTALTQELWQARGEVDRHGAELARAQGAVAAASSTAASKLQAAQAAQAAQESCRTALDAQRGADNTVTLARHLAISLRTELTSAEHHTMQTESVSREGRTSCRAEACHGGQRAPA